MKRYESLLNRDWQFAGPDGKDITVRLPHTWNNIDGQDGGNDYYRGTAMLRDRIIGTGKKD